MKKLLLLGFLALASGLYLDAQPYTFTTLAGGNGRGSADGPGSSAQFHWAEGIALDSSGNLYVTDYDEGPAAPDNANLISTIRKITPTGVVSTFAGRPGLIGHADGTGSGATFYMPLGVAIDGGGNTYVTDTNNLAIRKITSAGVVTTLAGGNFGSADGTGSAARFYNPFGVAVDNAGNVYVADTWNNTIRKISPTGVVSTLAGLAGSGGSLDATGGAARFNYPIGVAVGKSGTVYVADAHNNVIRQVTSAGVVTTVAGLAGSAGSSDGVGSDARFSNPYGITVDIFGNLYVVDELNHSVRKITPGRVVTTVSSGGLAWPNGIAIDSSGNLFITDSTFGVTDLGNRRVVKGVPPAGTVPAISTQPKSFVAASGASTSFSVGAAGIPALGYQWQRQAAGTTDFVSLSDTGVFRGASTATLTILSASIAFNGDRFRCVVSSGAGYTTISDAVSLGVLPPPVITTQPISQAVTVCGAVVLNTAATAGGAPTIQWQRNGSEVSGATGAALTINNVQPANAGLYIAVATSGVSAVSEAAIVGVSTTAKVVGTGTELQPVDIRHPNGNVFDQVLLNGPAETITADPTQATRTSFIDLNDDIVQVEFTGAGTLSLVLDNPTGPAPAVNYNQSGVTYMKGHAGIVITGANETSNLSVFSVGRVNAFDPTGAFNLVLPVSASNNPANNGSTLFVGHAATAYDGVADIAFIAITSASGKFGGVRASDASCFAAKGLTGIYAPGVQFTGPVYRVCCPNRLVIEHP